MEMQMGCEDHSFLLFTPYEVPGQSLKGKKDISMKILF